MELAYTAEQEALRKEIRAYFATLMTPEVEAEVVAHCRTHLAGFKCPRSFEVHGELPRSAAGKLTKRALRDPWWADRDTAI